MEDVNADGSTTSINEKSNEITLIKSPMTGMVRFFHRKRGWGFIIPDVKDTKDAFVNYRWINSNKDFKILNDGDFVKFDLYKANLDGKEVLQARNVTVINETLM